MAGTKAKLTLNGDTAVELDMLKDTLGQDVIDIHTLGSEGVFISDPGFISTVSCESRVTFIDGDEGILLHRGLPIDQLVTDSNYLETCYILLDGEKPIQEQYDESKTTVTYHTMVHEQIIRLLRASRRDSYPMAVMCDITGVLVVFYHGSLDINNPRHCGIATSRLLSKMPTMTAMYYKYSIGQLFVYPHNDLSYTGNFLNIMFSMPYELCEVNPILERAIDRILILRADHEQNASTSTVHTAGSSSADPFACIATGIASLWGPTRGGANETALKVLEEINSAKHIPEFVRHAKDKNDSFRLMGFGHRVYKNYDPYATVIRETCHEVLEELGTKDGLLEVVTELGNITLNDLHFIEKKLYPNVDSYSGIILKAIGTPSSMFTIIFTVVRTIGWIAHWSEVHSDSMKVARPRQLYTGYEKRGLKNDIKR